VRGRLRILVETESLFNDGTAAVLFAVGAALAAGRRSRQACSVCGCCNPSVAGSCAARWCQGGAGAGEPDRRPNGQTDVHHHCRLRFVPAGRALPWVGGARDPVCGLLIGNLGQGISASARTRVVIEAFWDFAAFVANSLIFLLIGIHEAQQDFHGVWKPALIAIALVTLDARRRSIRYAGCSSAATTRSACASSTCWCGAACAVRWPWPWR